MKARWFVVRKEGEELCLHIALYGIHWVVVVMMMMVVANVSRDV